MLVLGTVLNTQSLLLSDIVRKYVCYTLHTCTHTDYVETQTPPFTSSSYMITVKASFSSVESPSPFHGL